MPRMGISSGVSLSGTLTTVFKPAGFRFKLTRGDGALVDETLLSYISVHNSLGGGVATTKTYDPITEYWTVIITGATDPSGYWVHYACTSFGIPSQYPFRYRNVWKQQVADLIQPGTYEDEIPYWEIHDTEEDPEPVVDPVDICPMFDGVARFTGGVLYIKNTFTRNRKISTSVPYKVQYKINDHGSFYLYYGTKLLSPCGTFNACIVFGGNHNISSDDGVVDEDYIQGLHAGLLSWSGWKTAGMNKDNSMTISHTSPETWPHVCWDPPNWVPYDALKDFVEIYNLAPSAVCIEIYAFAYQ